MLVHSFDCFANYSLLKHKWMVVRLIYYKTPGSGIAKEPNSRRQTDCGGVLCLSSCRGPQNAEQQERKLRPDQSCDSATQMPSTRACLLPAPQSKTNEQTSASAVSLVRELEHVYIPTLHLPLPYWWEINHLIKGREMESFRRDW